MHHCIVHLHHASRVTHFTEDVQVVLSVPARCNSPLVWGQPAGPTLLRLTVATRAVAAQQVFGRGIAQAGGRRGHKSPPPGTLANVPRATHPQQAQRRASRFRITHQAPVKR